MEQNKRGFLVYAHNNEEIDYGKLALCCALMIKKHLRENATCLVTDQGTLDYLKSSMGEATVYRTFDHIKVTDYAFKKTSTIKNFRDTQSTNKTLTWHNTSRSSAYDLSPFEETIVLDSDYLVQDNQFDSVWGNYEDVLINRDAITLNHQAPQLNERKLESTSLSMYWATLIYFRKGEKARTLFDLVDHIKANYRFFQHIYEFPGKNYRNDYAFSIAIHMMSGFLESNEFKPFPVDKILSSFDVDELIDIEDGTMTFLTAMDSHGWDYNLTRTKGLSVHVMNKYSILRLADKIIKLYGN